jgi:glycosyltransferase involved in cell wall biosynthesis
MNILFAHQNFPGQYRHLAEHFGADPKHRVVALGEEKNIAGHAKPPGVERIAYRLARQPSRAAHAYLRTTEAAVLRGQAVARKAMELRQKGFVPDVICVHAGWGEGLYLRDIFPDARILAYFEFYYQGHGADVGFDPEFPSTMDDSLRIRTWNMTQQSTFFSSDWGIAPTEWQAAVFPPEFRQRLSVIHDGIDTETLRPDPDARLSFSNGRTLTRSDEVISFVSRGLEPYRGFHAFMRSLPELMKRRPQAQIVVVGGDTPSYGRRPKDAPNWRQHLMREVGDRIDTSRLHFVGKIPYAAYVALLQISRAHVYLSYPFVLSWSMLEAMAVGVPVLGSATPPVTEIVEHEKNGLLFDFFDREALVNTVCRVLDQPDLGLHLGNAGRQAVVDRFDVKRICLPAQVALIQGLVQKRPAVPASALVIGSDDGSHKSKIGTRQ